MYVSGCIIPTSLLPSLVRNIGYFLPTYYYFKLAGEFLTSNLSALIIIENLAISVVLMVISTYVLKLRVRKE